jgi:hypothetical protein
VSEIEYAFLVKVAKNKIQNGTPEGVRTFCSSYEDAYTSVVTGGDTALHGFAQKSQTSAPITLIALIYTDQKKFNRWF